MNNLHCIAASITLAVSPLAAAQFVPGDIYMHTHADPDWDKAIVRIDPVSGDRSLVYDISGIQVWADLTYDPCRHRLIFREDGFPDTLNMIDAEGTRSSLPFTWDDEVVRLIAPDGNGRLYMFSGTGKYGYLDEPGPVQPLLDDQGVPLVFIHLFTGRNDFIYDAPTNSLLLTEAGDATTIHKFSLNGNGTALTQPIVSATYDTFPDELDDPYGMSAGPNGRIFVKIDTNTGLDGDRMFTFDPITLAGQPFATVGYPFVGGNTAGSYNSVFANAPTLDTFNDEIRTFVEGPGVQQGTILATGVSGGGSGEQAELIVIGDTVSGLTGNGGCCVGDADGSGAVDLADLIGLLAAWGGPSATFDIAPAGGDGIVDISDLISMLANWGLC